MLVLWSYDIKAIWLEDTTASSLFSLDSPFPAYFSPSPCSSYAGISAILEFSDVLYWQKKNCYRNRGSCSLPLRSPLLNERKRTGKTLEDGRASSKWVAPLEVYLSVIYRQRNLSHFGPVPDLQDFLFHTLQTARKNTSDEGNLLDGNGT